MDLNISKYNLFIEENESFYIYNLLNTSIFKTTYSLFSFLKQNERTHNKIISTQFSKKMLDYLISNRIIYKENEDELDYMKFKHFKDKYDSSYLSVVVMPTLKCNLSCHYCYEKEKSISITDEQMSTLKLFFQKQSIKKKNIVVRWSGGEFLTKWKEVRQLSNFIIQQCEINNCTFLASAISNGTLITPKIVDEMDECHIKSVQITLDGGKDIHNKIRFTKNKKGTFDRIINAIEITSQKLKVIIRVNIDKNNYSSIDSLFQSLSQSAINKDNVQLFCRPVLCSLSRTPSTELFSHKEFYKVELHLLELAEKYNLPYAFHWGIHGQSVRCAYNCMEGLYLTPNLNMYKCPIYVDYEETFAVGHILKNGDFQINNYKEYLKCLSYSPFKIEECSNCKVLPICHGKCPVLWEQSGRSNEEGCIPEKFSIEEKIKYALRNQRQLLSLQKSGIL